MVQGKQLIRGLRIAVTVTSFLLGVACAKPAPAPEPMENLEPPPPATVEHQVRFQGETLGLISRWYTGKSSNWQAILDANPGLDPRRINLGNVILIPAELVVKDSPLPKEFVSASVGAAPSREPVAVTPAPVTVEKTPTRDVDEEKEQLRRDLEAALAAEVEAQQEAPEDDQLAAPPAEEPSMDADEIDRERLLDELLAE